MKVTRLSVRKFTAFEDATFEFAPGVNTFIGENGTGKSHVLKLVYAVQEALRRAEASKGRPGAGIDHFESRDAALAAMLAQVFLPDELGRLVRRAPGPQTAEIELHWEGAQITLSLDALGQVSSQASGDFSGLKRAVFLPPREVLSLFPGFISAWQERESSFDRTYYDLCVALDARPMRGPRPPLLSALLTPIEQALGGPVVMENGRFYLKLSDGDMEAPLVAEGLRKLAMIAYLIANGSLTANGFMFWDEPEANLNPKLAALAGGIVFGLADAGVQTFLATHDYALASEISLEVERRAAEHNPKAPAAFFGLGRTEGTAGITVERTLLLTELQNNPILDALASLHDREQAWSARQERG
jgi:energy-coupling factor transporter ATP-binding protein EcfA2